MDDLSFSKMHGAGNDFIVAECTPDSFAERLANGTDAAEKIPLLCDRRLGIGADGVILLKNLKRNRFRMTFFNRDGSRAGMCGNGLRCAALFAKRHMETVPGNGTFFFETESGEQKARVLSDGPAEGMVRIEITLNDPFRRVDAIPGFTLYAGTAGVPHAVVLLQNTDTLNMRETGSFLRNHPFFQPGGTNVDFVEYPAKNADGVHRIRTYERGVEDETPACGTGIVAAGAVLHKFFHSGENLRFLSRSGDRLDVDISRECNILRRAGLTGPAAEVFRGTLTAPLRRGGTH